jgi:copper chaperone CopZ
MRLTKWTVLPVACCLVALTGTAAALAETVVEVKGVHLCCGACVKGVASAVKKVDGASPKCDQKAGTVTITAKDDETAQKALDAMAAAGYHGDTGNASLAIKPTEGVPSGSVKKLKVSGIHNCCPGCNKAVKAAVKTVSGVESDTAKSKSGTLEVTGDFDAAAVIKALNDAGFHVKVESE